MKTLKRAEIRTLSPQELDNYQSMLSVRVVSLPEEQRAQYQPAFADIQAERQYRESWEYRRAHFIAFIADKKSASDAYLLKMLTWDKQYLAKIATNCEAFPNTSDQAVLSTDRGEYIERIALIEAEIERRKQAKE